MTPIANVGDITGDLSAKRGQISGTQTLRDSVVAIGGLVPLSELENYQARVKSVTGGQGSYSLELSHYEPVPHSIQQELIDGHKASRIEE